MHQSDVGEIRFSASFPRHEALHAWAAGLPEALRAGIQEVYVDSRQRRVIVPCVGPFPEQYGALAQAQPEDRAEIDAVLSRRFEDWLTEQSAPREMLLDGKALAVLWWPARQASPAATVD
jgi:hypothetical protein